MEETSLEKAIELAIKGGYTPSIIQRNPGITPQGIKNIIEMVAKQKIFLLDSEFWKCLGKSLGWKGVCDGALLEGFKHSPKTCVACEEQGWKDKWHSFIDWLIDGKSPSTFFDDLLQ